MRSRTTTAAAILLALAACDEAGHPDDALAQGASGRGTAAPPVCRVVEAGRTLPDEIRESSGLARSHRDPNVLWTHNDAGNEPVVFAIDTDGRLLGRTAVTGAQLQDWEDLAAGPCDSGSCLYVGDIGDNDADRETIVVYEIPEPAPGAQRTDPARELRARFPDGARDAEALFVLPSGDIYVVTKGRHGPIALYRYPAPHRPAEVVTLERVRELAPQPGDENDRVTGATATPDGRWVGIRTYRTLTLYPTRALVGRGSVEPERVDLGPLGEAQGESLAIDDGGSVWLSSEAANREERPRWGRLQCALSTPGA